MWWNVPEVDPANPEKPSPKLLVLAGTANRRQRAVLTMVQLDRIRPNADQPRKHFDPERIAELSASIKERGLIQPIVVRRTPDGYELLAGERRFRASKQAGLSVIPALVRDKDDPLETALIENLQREDLSPLEEAEALQGLADRHSYSHRELADLLGKSRPYVSNALVLLRMPERVKEEIHRDGLHVPRELLMGVARAASEPEAEALWDRLKVDLMSVRRFRAERSGGSGATRSAAREVLLAARRLNRKLRKLRENGLEIDPEERQSVLRVLRKSVRLAGEQIDALG